MARKKQRAHRGSAGKHRNPGWINTGVLTIERVRVLLSEAAALLAVAPKNACRLNGWGGTNAYAWPAIRAGPRSSPRTPNSNTGCTTVLYGGELTDGENELRGVETLLHLHRESRRGILILLANLQRDGLSGAGNRHANKPYAPPRELGQGPTEKVTGCALG